MATEPARANILLFGAGSIGAVYIHQLQRAQCSVTAVCRSNYESVKKDGFRLRSTRFGNVTFRPDHVVRSIDEATTPFDFVLVCTKADSGQKPSLADVLRPVLKDSPNTAVVLAQNGIMIEQEVAAAFPENPILSGVVYLPAHQTSPGTIEYPETMNLLELGTYPADAPPRHKAAAQAFAQLLISGGGEAEVHDDIQISRWSKLCMNAVFNPICALTLCTDGEFLTTSDPFARDLAWDTMLEIVRLAQALGFSQVTREVADTKIQIATRRARDGTGREMSMLQDVRLSRPLEVEAIMGNVVRLARQNNLRLPRLETLYALARARSSIIIKDGAKSTSRAA